MNENTSTSRDFRPSPTLLICSIAALVAVVGLFLPSLSPVQTSSTSTAGSDDGIQIVDFDYSGTLVVGAGQSVQVVNIDGVPHTVTAEDGSFDSGVIAAGANGAFLAPDTDGVISFICTIHPSMSGELTVSS